MLRLASRIDAVASRVQSAIHMKQVLNQPMLVCVFVCHQYYIVRKVTRSMGSITKSLDKAMQSMNLEQVHNFCLYFINNNDHDPFLLLLLLWLYFVKITQVMDK
jgi:hypothetical protein